MVNFKEFLRSPKEISTMNDSAAELQESNVITFTKSNVQDAGSINNLDTQDSDEPSSSGWLPCKEVFFLWYYVVIASCCMVFYGFDASVYNAVLGNKYWMEYNLNPSDNAQGGTNTAYTVASIITGFFISGQISNKFGRKVPMGIACILIVVATIMQTCQPRGIGVFLGGRLIIGLANGLSIPVAPVYISEIALSSMRGKNVIIFQVFYSIGSFICFIINYACTKNIDKLKDWSWRIVILFQLLAPCTVFFNLPFMPESPRYLVSMFKYEEAKKALIRIRDPSKRKDLELEFHEIRAAIEYEQAVDKPTIWNQYKMLFTKKSLRKRFLIALVINGGQQLTGQGSLNSYSSKIYKKVFTSDDTIQLINALNAVFGILFTFNGLFIVERFGRRPLLMISGAGMAVAMLIIAVVETNVPVNSDGSIKYSTGIVTVFLFFLYELFYKPGWGGTVWIVTSEIFPMEVRSNAVGMASQFQNVSNAIVNQFFPTFLSKKGFLAMYLFFAINAFLTIFVFFFIPETRGKSLEEIDELFDGVSHVRKGEQLHEVSNLDDFQKENIDLVEDVNKKDAVTNDEVISKV